MQFVNCIQEEEIVGSKFGCKPNFTVVQWQDITNDDQLEIIVTTLSADKSQDVSPSEDLLNEEGCLNQRLLAYQWSQDNIREIANIAGCVVQADLYGVQLKDWDDDGQLEILAADQLTDPATYYSSWSEPIVEDRIYKWSGVEFTFWKRMPR